MICREINKMRSSKKITGQNFFCRKKNKSGIPKKERVKMLFIGKLEKKSTQNILLGNKWVQEGDKAPSFF